MGHGIRAALVTAILRGLVAELKPGALDTACFVAAINHSLADVLRGGDEISRLRRSTWWPTLAADG